MFVTVEIGKGTQLLAAPMHGGHHPIWAGDRFQADICNMVDDLVIGDRKYGGGAVRFPITGDLWPQLEALIRLMDDYDGITRSPWQLYNGAVRLAIMTAARERLDRTPMPVWTGGLNLFQPGLIAPALAGGARSVDRTITRMLETHPEATAPAGALPQEG
jgi:hypothetical protein